MTQNAKLIVHPEMRILGIMHVTKQPERKYVTKIGLVRIAQLSVSLEMINMVITNAIEQVE